MLAIGSLQREISGVKPAYQIDIDAAFSMFETELGDRSIHALLGVLDDNENPFEKNHPQTKLYNTVTEEVMPDEIRKQLLQIETTGTETYEKFREGSLVEKTGILCQTIHRTTLKTLMSIHKNTNKNKGGGKSPKETDNKHQQRMTEIARERGRSMKELLEYDLTSSTYPFDQQVLISNGLRAC